MVNIDLLLASFVHRSQSTAKLMPFRLLFSKLSYHQWTNKYYDLTWVVTANICL